MPDAEVALLLWPTIAYTAMVAMQSRARTFVLPAVGASKLVHREDPTQRWRCQYLFRCTETCTLDHSCSGTDDGTNAMTAAI
ncbi:hypothetical protein EDB85DRAFT_2028868 [Lactarius pseudohatsudake]|nr:hypothetical protein EDB85DRAFT_2028868 [Lactarius pseudohatsudake]